MKIKEIISRSRRDFTAIYECEHCGRGKVGNGYDDDYFHRYVIPRMKCDECGKKAGDDYRPFGTKYAAHEII